MLLLFFSVFQKTSELMHEATEVQDSKGTVKVHLNRRHKYTLIRHEIKITDS